MVTNDFCINTFPSLVEKIPWAPFAFDVIVPCCNDKVAPPWTKTAEFTPYKLLSSIFVESPEFLFIIQFWFVKIDSVEEIYMQLSSC